MDTELKVLQIDAATGLYRIRRYPVGPFFGPVDLGLHLSGRLGSLNFGAGLLAGSIFPGSNRLIFTGYSPCWGGFYISSMGGAALVFDNLGINLVAVCGRAPTPSMLYLNRTHGEEIEVELVPIDTGRVWREGRGGVYNMMEVALQRFGERYTTDPRVMAVGPAAATTDMGAIVSVPLKRGALTHVDTWAGRGGLGSKLLQEHGVAAICYGGSVVDEDFRDRKVADQWFENRYQQRVAAKDFEATTKYRFNPAMDTGGTLGVNYATVGGRILAFNYRTINWEEGERLDLHQRLVVDHYLRQFNDETIAAKQQHTCGEPCSAVCKKMNGPYKKDYEPYQTMGPLCGVFDQRAAERLVGHADMLGFDSISVGGVLSWLLESLHEDRLTPAELGVDARPAFEPAGFGVETDSKHNAELGVALLDAIVEPGGRLDLREGARKLARSLARERGRELLDPFVYAAFGRNGWMVPNQYWTPGVLSPLAISGKYYMYYGNDFLSPRELGRVNADRLVKELTIDNLGVCRFHRGWAEEMLPEIIGALYGTSMQAKLGEQARITASRINSRNASVFWEPGRNTDYLRTFLTRKRDIEGVRDDALDSWIERFSREPGEAALAWWYECHKGTHESLREF